MSVYCVENCGMADERIRLGVEALGESGKLSYDAYWSKTMRRWYNDREFISLFFNRECQYYPCHEGIEEMNCLFCYCPLYERRHCPGKPEYIKSRREDGSEVQIKSCMKCTFPHQAENYDVIMQFLRKGDR